MASKKQTQKDMENKVDGRGRKAQDSRSADQNPIRELTKAELEIMRILWNRQSAFVSDIMEHIEEPKPAYNTVSTIVRILEKKGFVSHRPLGRVFSYYPIVSREQYTANYMDNVLTTFFDNSLPRMVSFFAENENISVKELDDIMDILNKNR